MLSIYCEDRRFFSSGKMIVSLCLLLLVLEQTIGCSTSNCGELSTCDSKKCPCENAKAELAETKDFYFCVTGLNYRPSANLNGTQLKPRQWINRLWWDYTDGGNSHIYLVRLRIANLTFADFDQFSVTFSNGENVNCTLEYTCSLQVTHEGNSDADSLTKTDTGCPSLCPEERDRQPVVRVGLYQRMSWSFCVLVDIMLEEATLNGTRLMRGLRWHGKVWRYKKLEESLKYHVTVEISNVTDGNAGQFEVILKSKTTLCVLNYNFTVYIVPASNSETSGSSECTPGVPDFPILHILAIVATIVLIILTVITAFYYRHTLLERPHQRVWRQHNKRKAGTVEEAEYINMI